MTEKFGAPALIRNADPRIVALDIGGTNARIRHTHEPNAPIHQIRTPDTYQETIEHISRTVGSLLNRKRPDAVGFGVAGQLGTDGIIVKAGKLKEYGWVGKNPGADIADALGISPDMVAGAGDVAAAAKAEQAARNAQTQDYIFEGLYTISTGVGGALYTPAKIIPTEPGHEFFREGAVCGCGADGCLEAHISGSGIARKYSTPPESIPHDDQRWDVIRHDMVEGFSSLLSHYKSEFGHTPSRLSFYGSVAFKGPGILQALQTGLHEQYGWETPEITPAAFGDNNGLEGAHLLARERLQS